MLLEEALLLPKQCALVLFIVELRVVNVVLYPGLCVPYHVERIFAEIENDIRHQNVTVPKDPNIIIEHN